MDRRFLQADSKIHTDKTCVSPAGLESAPHTEEHQHDHHRNGDEAAASAAVPTATAIVVVVSAATTAAGRAAEVAVERRHVLDRKSVV